MVLPLRNVRRSSLIPPLAHRDAAGREVGEVLEFLPHLVCVVVAGVALDLPLVFCLGLYCTPSPDLKATSLCIYV